MDLEPELTALAAEARGMAGRVAASTPDLTGLGDRVAQVLGGTVRRSDIAMAGLIDGTSGRLNEAVAALAEAAARADAELAARARGGS
ncbi:hypothetical protein [Microlunatus parietis]|uniref:Uncharacterized protein n=1 Tax=Microlunatus parietis TaxID=682979 RepID=A0A7Y9IEP6_9ACTN|nr:hypothetical protein [Microlunatus parietis]NYE75246.1 hypothetical protein [Microlunatus parietis]